ncbi:MAG: cytochrome c oxidase cbb3-type subunit 4 [Planctomycetota bacterium]|jgi:cytochrome c oxidase cbb3-type subunit 4
MNLTLFHSFWTIVVLATFIGIILWAYSRNRQQNFDEAARIPLEDDPDPQLVQDNRGHDNKKQANKEQENV